MTFPRYALSRQLIAEERVGRAARAEGHAEDAIWAQSTQALSKMK
jgi:hypothetical protein